MISRRASMLAPRSALVVVAILLVPRVVFPVTIGVEGGSARAGDSIDVCISMKDSGGQVSGVQMDIGWAADCLSIDALPDGEAACQVNPGTGRDTFKTRLLPNAPGLRAILLSISDVSPIPAAETGLFCCSFRVAAGAARSCPVSLSNVIASNPRGQRLPVTTMAGAVTIRSIGSTPGTPASPLPAASPGGPATGVPPAASGSSGGGCQLVHSPRPGAVQWVLVGSVLWRLARRRLRTLV